MIALLFASLLGVAQASDPALTHGLATGDVTPTAAVLWGRADGPGTLVAVVHPLPWHHPFAWSAPVDAASDFTGHIALTGLQPDTRYVVSLRFVDADGAVSPAAQGSFRTAPLADAARPVRLVVGGDVGGQGFCRRLNSAPATSGYPIFSAMKAASPDLFVANGDLIYADSPCDPSGPRGVEGWFNKAGGLTDISDPEVDWTDAQRVQEIYWKRWRYNREDPHVTGFLADVSILAQWDDHEVINDFGGGWDHWNAEDGGRPGYPNIVAAGRKALFDYNPIDPAAEAEGRVHRSFRWGRDLEVFIVDARSFRSPNDAPDGLDKTLLGADQLAWLVERLSASDATFKLVSVDVPLAIPTGSYADRRGRDSWANGTDPDGSAQTGFESELRALLTALDAAHVKGVVFTATDVHFAQIARFDLDLDGDGVPLVFHEVVCGPLSASRSAVRLPDPTFSPQVLFAAGDLFNFAVIEVRRDGDQPVLTIEIHDEHGAVLEGSRVALQAAR